MKLPCINSENIPSIVFNGHNENTRIISEGIPSKALRQHNLKLIYIKWQETKCLITNTIAC